MTQEQYIRKGHIAFHNRLSTAPITLEFVKTLRAPVRTRAVEWHGNIPLIYSWAEIRELISTQEGIGGTDMPSTPR